MNSTQEIIPALEELVEELVKALDTPQVSLMDPSIIVRTEPSIEHLLNNKAKELCKHQYKSLMVVPDKESSVFKLHSGVKTEAKAVFITNLIDTSKLSIEEHVAEHANILNKLADSGLWVEGVLAEPSYVTLVTTGQTTIFTFPFVDAKFFFDCKDKELDPNAELNRIMGCNNFVNEGEIT